MKNLDTNGFSVIEALLILVIVAVIGGAGYFVYNAQKNTNATLDNTAKSQTEPQKTEKKEAEKVDKPVDKTKATKEVIVKALDNHDYDSLGAVMEDAVSYARESSDTAKNNATKAEAIHQLEQYFKPSSISLGAETPWDFGVMGNDTKFASNIKAAKNTAFDDAYIGRSKDKGMFVAFKFGSDGLIKSFWYGISIYND